MLRYLPVLLLAGFFLEIASIIWVGRVLGVILTLVLIVAGAAVGMALFRKAGLTVAAALRAPIQDRTHKREIASSTAFSTLAGLFFMVPGFFSDVIAVLLLFPPVQAWIVARMKIVTVTAGGAQAQRGDRFGTVIEAEAVEIKGEILPPERPDR